MRFFIFWCFSLWLFFKVIILAWMGNFSTSWACLHQSEAMAASFSMDASGLDTALSASASSSAALFKAWAKVDTQQTHSFWFTWVLLLKLTGCTQFFCEKKSMKGRLLVLLAYLSLKLQHHSTFCTQSIQLEMLGRSVCQAHPPSTHPRHIQRVMRLFHLASRLTVGHWGNNTTPG